MGNVFKLRNGAKTTQFTIIIALRVNYCTLQQNGGREHRYIKSARGNQQHSGLIDVEGDNKGHSISIDILSHAATAGRTIQKSLTDAVVRGSGAGLGRGLGALAGPAAGLTLQLLVLTLGAWAARAAGRVVVSARLTKLWGWTQEPEYMGTWKSFMEVSC